MELRLEKSLYNQEALNRASYSLASILTATLSSNSDEWIIDLKPSSGISDDTARAEFLIAVNDEELRQTVRVRTEKLRMLILAHAYSRTKFTSPEDSA
jgi:His-Xaa-Ser system protein HxsD